MHKRIQIKNAIIVNEGRQFVGSLLIDNNQIGQILEGKDAVPDEPPMEVVNADGCYLLPGVIDEHVHFREPGLTEKADFETESYAAAAGGVTTVFDMPNTLPTTTTLEAFNEKYDMAATKSHVNFGLYFGATLNNYELLPQLKWRSIAGVKLFMGASTGNMLVDDKTVLRYIFEKTPTLLMVHCEDTPTIAANMKTEQIPTYAITDLSGLPKRATNPQLKQWLWHRNTEHDSMWLTFPPLANWSSSALPIRKSQRKYACRICSFAMKIISDWAAVSSVTRP